MSRTIPISLMMLLLSMTPYALCHDSKKSYIMDIRRAIAQCACEHPILTSSYVIALISPMKSGLTNLIKVALLTPIAQRIGHAYVQDHFITHRQRSHSRANIFSNCNQRCKKIH